jgi:hypothetical protein
MQGECGSNILQDGGRDFCADRSGGEILGDEGDRSSDLSGDICSHHILPSTTLMFSFPLYPRRVNLAEFLLTNQGLTRGIVVSSAPYLQFCRIKPHIVKGPEVQFVEADLNVIRFEKTLK